MRTDFAGVIFDNDGTLIDSQEALVRAWTTWAQEYQVTADNVDDWHGRSSESIVRALVPADRADAAVARIQELEVGEVTGVVPLPGVTDALASLRGAPIAIATSGTRPVAMARLTAAGLEPPEIVVTADDITHAKPDPEIFRVACERLGLPADQCLVVEDSISGVAAARAAGCASLAVGTTTDPQLLGDADAVVATLAEVRFEVRDGRVGIIL